MAIDWNTLVEVVTPLIKEMGIIPEDEHYEVAAKIIEECINVIEDFNGVENFSYMINPRHERLNISCEIKEHFGLED